MTAKWLFYRETKTHFYFILPDRMAGRRDRYTAYRALKGGMKNVRVIGRELTRAHALRCS